LLSYRVESGIFAYVHDYDFDLFNNGADPTEIEVVT